MLFVQLAHIAEYATGQVESEAIAVYHQQMALLVLEGKR